jgi:hypothetical protein
VITTFAIGLLFGLRHALDADHIAAVASLATRTGSSRGETVRVGIAWGLGHALTLFLVCAVVLVMDIAFPERLAQLAEFLVGAMLLFLGLGVVRRAWRGRLHIHGHRHGAGYHVHVHSHAGEGNHKQSRHQHGHARGLPKRAVLVGLMHGLAGSAALLLLSVGAQGTVVFGLAYVALFGIGSMIGMAALSATMAYPLRIAGRVSAWGFNAFYGVIGAATVALGVLVMVETGSEAASWLALL